ncbi:unnamed protein product [Allacma fusca]|uniref:Uncharacterized protein n=1 Tax=Allacma fusca TaxID=39272 RepID=A0A8J2NW24_9HEXA|nr:unnamed protein product [Allacma fusca]
MLVSPPRPPRVRSYRDLVEDGYVLTIPKGSTTHTMIFGGDSGSISWKGPLKKLLDTAELFPIDSADSARNERQFFQHLLAQKSRTHLEWVTLAKETAQRIPKLVTTKEKIVCHVAREPFGLDHSHWLFEDSYSLLLRSKFQLLLSSGIYDLIKGIGRVFLKLSSAYRLKWLYGLDSTLPNTDLPANIYIFSTRNTESQSVFYLWLGANLFFGVCLLVEIFLENTLRRPE